MLACGVLSARKQSFEESSSETDVGRCLLTPEPRPLPPLAPAPRTRPRHTNRTPSWTSDLCRRYLAWNWTIPVVMLATVVATTGTLSSNSCKSASFLCILLPLYGNSSPGTTFLREAISYKRALALRNLRQIHIFCIVLMFSAHLHCLLGIRKASVR